MFSSVEEIAYIGKGHSQLKLYRLNLTQPNPLMMKWHTLRRNYPLRINKNQSRNTLAFVDGEFLVDITNQRIDEDARSQIKRLYNEWTMRIAYPILKTKVEMYSQKLGVDIQKILVKKSLKSRWASLRSKGSIIFNLHLIKAPQEVIDYIVLHEEVLVHNNNMG